MVAPTTVGKISQRFAVNIVFFKMPEKNDAKTAQQESSEVSRRPLGTVLNWIRVRRTIKNRILTERQNN